VYVSQEAETLAVHSLLTIQDTEAIKRNSRNVRKRRAFAQRVTYATLMVESSAVPTRPLNLPRSISAGSLLSSTPTPLSNLKETSNKVSRHFRWFLTTVYCSLTVSGEPRHGWRWGRWDARVPSSKFLACSMHVACNLHACIL